MYYTNQFNLHELASFTVSLDLRFNRSVFDSKVISLSELSNTLKSESVVPENTKDKKFMNQALDIVQKRVPDSSFDFEEFAKEMNVSKSTLYKMINKFFGLTPVKLILTHRIDLAKHLLSDNYSYVSEVAYRVGFNDPRYFTRCFKTETGLSPREYRESIKQKSATSFNQPDNNLFLKKVFEKLETKMNDCTFDMDQFATEMKVSKATLFRRFKTTTGLSPGEFIRSVRIKRSAQLLAKYNNISEVAFAVGFNDSKYFSRCFKSEFGVTPTQYQELLAC